MTTETYSPHEKINELNVSYVNFLAEKLKSFDKKNKAVSKQIHDAKVIYALFGLCDGFSSSIAFVRFMLDVIFTNSSRSASDVMHDWSLTEEGIAFISIQSVGMIALSTVANFINDSDPKEMELYLARFREEYQIMLRGMAIIWPYMREIIKGLKNAYKGTESLLKMMRLLGANNVNPFMLPLGLLLGSLAVGNRVWIRSMRNQRKQMMKNNKDLLKIIEEAVSLSKEDFLKYKDQINFQDEKTKQQAYVAAFLSGILDSPYNYLGVVGVATLAPPLFIPMAVFCMVYCTTLLLTRCNEEYNYQRDLKILEARAKLALFSKRYGSKMVQELLELHALSQRISTAVGSEKLILEQQQAELWASFKKKKNSLKAQRDALKNLLAPSYVNAFLTGAHNGLAVYSAITAAMFAVTTVYAMASASFPPFLLLPIVSLGIACLLVFITHALVLTYKQRREEAKKNSDDFYEGLADDDSLIETLKLMETLQNNHADLVLKEKVQAVLEEQIKDPPSTSIADFAESFRAGSSGFKKGCKAINVTMNPLLEQGDDGNYHDTPLTMALSGVSAIVHALIMGLRAHARAFGKDKKTSKTLETDSSKLEPLIEVNENEGPEESNDPEQEGQPQTQPTHSPNSNNRDSRSKRPRSCSIDNPSSFFSASRRRSLSSDNLLLAKKVAEDDANLQNGLM